MPKGPAFDPDAFRNFEHKGWNRVSLGYHNHWERLTKQAIPQMLDVAGVTTGMDVLDVAYSDETTSPRLRLNSPAPPTDAARVIHSKIIERKIQELSPLSESAAAILRFLGTQDHSLRDLLGVIECDGPLTVRVLSVVNSTAFAVSAKIEAIEHAVVYLGEREVVTIALSFAASELFGSDSEDRVEGIWEDAVRTALAARLLAAETDGVDPALAYTGGLLRDIGRTVLWPLLKNGRSDLDDCIASGAAGELIEAERVLTGTDHCAVGAKIADHFGLSSDLVKLIQLHHEPSPVEEDLRPLVDLVHVADAMTAAMPADTSCVVPPVGLDSSSAERIGFGLIDIGWLTASLAEEYARAAALVEL